MALSIYKRELLDIYNCAVSSVKPELVIEKALSFGKDQLIIREPDNTRTSILLYNKSLHIIGGGKCTLSMACGSASIAVRANVAHLFSHGCLSVPVDQRSRFEKEKLDRLLCKVGVKCLFGSKDNLPDGGSVVASESILNSIRRVREDSFRTGRDPVFILLLSGGGSACLTKPKFISLEEKLNLIRFLAQRGADIVELNTVRRCFSSIKGGHLATYILKQCPMAKIVTLILSDVVGDPIDVIASGPTYIPKPKDILKHESTLKPILTKYKYPNMSRLLGMRADTDMEMLDDIRDLIKFYDVDLDSQIHNKVVGNNLVAFEAALNLATNLGYNVISLGNKIQGSTEDVITDMLTEAKGTNLNQEKTLIIGAGEATVSKKPNEQWGLGGRAQEMALDYLIATMNRCDSSNGSLDLFLAASTDGQDGPTEVAACMASSSEIHDNIQAPIQQEELLEAKKAHDSYNFWKTRKPEWLFCSGPTGTNVMDLYMLVKARR